MVYIFWEQSPVSSWHVFFLVSILNNKPCHIPLKWRCPIKKSDHIRLTYLTTIGVGYIEGAFNTTRQLLLLRYSQYFHMYVGNWSTYISLNENWKTNSRITFKVCLEGGVKCLVILDPHKFFCPTGLRRRSEVSFLTLKVWSKIHMQYDRWEACLTQINSTFYQSVMFHFIIISWNLYKISCITSKNWESIIKVPNMLITCNTWESVNMYLGQFHHSKKDVVKWNHVHMLWL